MDVLTAGPAVAHMTAVFDDYWNSPHAYPIEHLATRISTDAARWHFEKVIATLAAPDLAAITRDALGQPAIGPQIAAGRIQLEMAAVRVVADSPRKADADNESLADGVVMNGNLDLMQSARSEVLIASPYFVPSRRTMDVLQRASEHLVDVSIMTNSLATTDEPLAHFGYARYRQALLERRVALYELMPNNDEHEAQADGPRGSLGRLHAKLAVVDRRWLSIGSMNMDRRSAHSNTEMGLIVDSPALAAQVADLLCNDRLPRSYQVRSTSGRKGIEWVSQRGSTEVVLRKEPNATAARKLRLQMLAALVDEDLL